MPILGFFKSRISETASQPLDLEKTMSQGGSGVPQLVAISLLCQLLVLILSVLVIGGEIGLSQISTRQGEVSFH